MTKKQMQDRIAELEAMVQTLTTAINAMRTPIYVGPAIPAQPQAQCNMGHQEG